MATTAMEEPTSPLSCSLDDTQSLRLELERLTSEIIEANEERGQAAKYGLVILEEKQALQSQYEELNILYESTKRELENSVNQFKQVQADYEKRLKEVELQRDQLLSEMETREATLIAKVGKLEDEKRQLERKLKQSLSEQEHLSEHTSYLTGEIDRHRREVDLLKEENKKQKQEQGSTEKDNSELRKEVDKLEKRLGQLLKYEEECAGLEEANKALKVEMETVQVQYESILAEKEDLEYQNSETTQALNEEREANSVLEIKLKEQSLRSPLHPNWAVEKEAFVLPSPDGNHNNHNDERFLSTTSPTPAGARIHSTPFSNKKMPNLLSELQTSFMANVDLTELESLRQRCKEADDSITALQKEKIELDEKVMSFSLQQTQSTSELDRLKEEYTKALAERDTAVESLKEDLLIKEELLGQLRNKLSTTCAERASMAIEVDGLTSELQRIRVSSAQAVEKNQKEWVQEQAKNTELKGEVAILEDEITHLSNTILKLEAIIYSSHTAITTMAEDIRVLHKTVARLGADGRLVVPSREVSPLGGVAEEGGTERPVSPPDDIYYSLELKNGRTRVQVHNETHSLLTIAQLHEQVRAIRLPLEQFTKTMLERSLAQSTKHFPTDHQAVLDKSAPSSHRNSHDLEATVNKWKAKLAHKAEEVSNLRAIMRARATTADVAISSLRSKLEGQARAYQTELTRLKHQLKSLKRDRDEHNSLRSMYAKRCEDYVDEITKTRRELDTMKRESDELMLCLKKTIQRKLDLCRELEEYRVEQERVHLIPKLLGSSRI